MWATAQDEGASAEGVGQCLVRGLGAVDHEQERALGRRAALDLVGEQRLAGGASFRRVVWNAQTASGILLR